MGNPQIVNSFNMFKVIAESDSPNSLLSTLSDKLLPLSMGSVVKEKNFDDKLIGQNDGKVFKFYLHYFDQYKFLRRDIKNAD